MTQDRQKLEADLKHAADYAYEATMSDYSVGSINRATESLKRAKEAILDAGGSVDANHNVTWQKTAEQIAEEVLRNHAIQPHWVRTGEQLKNLLEEAVHLARGES